MIKKPDSISANADTPPVANPEPIAPIDEVVTLAPSTAPVTGNELIPLSLDEYCARLSRIDRRVELIAAFHHWLSHDGGLTFATEPEFLTQFHIFTGVVPDKD